MLSEGDAEVEEVCSVYIDVVTALKFLFDVVISIGLVG